MAFKPLNVQEWQKSFRRTLLYGWPNSWKTTAIFRDSDGQPGKAWPRPIGYMAYPGEQGTASVPVHENAVVPFVWESDPAAKNNPVKDWAEVQKETKKLLTGAYGAITTFAGDGLHKLYQLIYDAKLSELTESYPSYDPDKLGGRAYGLAHKEFLGYLHDVCSSAVPYVVMTCWAGFDKDDPNNQKGPSHIHPDLPGQMRQWVLGEFGCVLYAEAGQEIAPGKVTKGRWQTRPFGKVWGAGIKVPASVASKVPTYVPQDWKTLETVVFTGGLASGTYPAAPTPVPAANAKPAA